MNIRITIPQLVPELSRGRHRSARRGACFMEFASYLAGERWSDHPACTDPVLAALARAVNDLVDDRHRAGLVIDIPRVVGLRGDDDLPGMRVALHAALAALPVASMERQNALAAGLLALSAALESDGRLGDDDRRMIERVLAEVPAAARWGREMVAAMPGSRAELVRRGCTAIVRTSALGIAQACVPDPDARLVALLRAAIADVERQLTRPVAVAPTSRLRPVPA